MLPHDGKQPRLVWRSANGQNLYPRGYSSPEVVDMLVAYNMCEPKPNTSQGLVYLSLSKLNTTKPVAAYIRCMGEFRAFKRLVLLQ